ncbi:Pyrrolidone-carboxylate peptidase, partial [Tetrabaena socialis]
PELSGIPSPPRTAGAGSGRPRLRASARSSGRGRQRSRSSHYSRVAARRHPPLPRRSQPLSSHYSSHYCSPHLSTPAQRPRVSAAVSGPGLMPPSRGLAADSHLHCCCPPGLRAPGRAMAQPSTEFCVTGFGPFRGVGKNPTEQLVLWLQQQLEGGALHEQLGPHIRVRNTSVLRVAADDVDAFLASLGPDLDAEAQQGGGAASPTPPPATDTDAQAPFSRGEGRQLVLLHLGVANEALQFRLESRAYNCATFRVPDERGWQPQEHELDPGLGTQSYCGTALPLGALAARLVAAGHPCTVSEDAGLFVCNWTYYRSCRHAQARGWHSLFVHVPMFAVVGEEAQRAFVLDVIRGIADCLAGGAPAAAAPAAFLHARRNPNHSSPLNHSPLTTATVQGGYEDPGG